MDPRAMFAEFREDALRRFQVKVRRRRAHEIRALLARSSELTLDVFNREVWNLETSVLLDGERLPANELFFNDDLSADRIAELDEALDGGRLELHGNTMWGTATQVFGPQLRDVDDTTRLELVRRAAQIATDDALSASEKARALMDIRGFGSNAATGIVMAMHPTEFALSNAVSRAALDQLGYPVQPLDAFERSVRELAESVGSDDFIELDWFLFQVNARNDSSTVGANWVWLVRAGEGGGQESYAIDEHRVVIGWDQLADLSEVSSPNEIRELLAPGYRADERPEQTLTRHANEVYSFVTDMKPGDLAILPLTSGLVAVGEVESGYEYLPDAPEGCHHSRRVRWLRLDVPRGAFGTAFRSDLGYRGTVHAFSGTDPKGRVLRIVRGERESTLSALLQLALDAEANNDEDALSGLISERIPRQVATALTRDWPIRAHVSPELPAVTAVPSAPTGDAVGFEVSYLLRQDASGVVLSLNQPSDPVPLAALQKRAIDLRRAAGIVSEARDSDIDLRSDSSHARNREAASAYSITYLSGAIPDDAALEDDLAAVVGLAEHAVAAGLSFDAREVVHLLFKWAPKSAPDTIDSQREIAAERGLVWWGQFGDPHQTAMPDSSLRTIRDQLDGGLITHVYLLGGEQLWRTTLRRITGDPNEVDDDRRPSSYTKEECNLFVEIAEFEALQPSWAADQLVIASNPDPSATPSELNNRTTPLEVFELFGPPSEASYSLDWLASETLWPVSDLDDVIGALKRGPGQVILAGPPGTGKTWVAQKLGYHLTAGRPEAYNVVQFHPSYGYEDFIEGIRPVVASGAVEFRVEPGTIIKTVRAMDTQPGWHVLVLDEINRANLPRVFGELMYALEYRDQDVDLQYSKDFRLPPNLLFIGTMNTADRSIRSIDVALRRRFEIFECFPDAEILQRYYDAPGRENEVPDLIDGFQALNQKLTDDLDRHHTIGQTFFMNDRMTPERLRSTWRRQLAPLIEEYFFDQPDVAADYAFEVFWPGVT